MQYKALMLDVDGTIIPYEYAALPSPKVIAAIKKAQEKVDVFLVTGRAYNATAKILASLGMEQGYIVTNAGGVVLDLATKKSIYEKPIENVEAREIISLLQKENLEFYVKENIHDGAWERGIFKKDDILKKAYMIFTMDDLSEERVDDILKKLSHLPHLNMHKTQHKNPHTRGINITHAEATKLHGIEMLSKKFGLKREEIIGIGDGYNDFPLLMASGLKVAMGNANDELKKIADYIAPPVTEDGVATVIEKFILNPTSS